jgi:hypothetical protein
MALGALFAMPLGGAVIGRIGSSAVTRVATIVYLAVVPLPIVAPHALILVAALFVFGAANGLMDVGMNAHGVTVERRFGRPIMSSLHGMWSLGGLLGAGLAALLLPLMPPIAQALLTLALLAATAVAALFFLLPSAADNGEAGSGFVLPGRAALGLGILCFLAMTSEGAIIDWSALHLQASLALTPALAAGGFAAFSAAMAAARFGGDWLRGHVGAVALVRGSAALAAAGLALALAAPWPFLAIAGFGIAGLGLANLVPVFFGAAGRLPGQAAGTGIAAVATLGYSGFLVGPPLIGFLADVSSLAFALGLLVVACLTVAVAAAAVEPAGTRGPS